MTAGLPIPSSGTANQVWLAVKIWLGGLFGFSLITVALSLLGLNGADVYFTIFVVIQFSNCITWAWDFIHTRRKMALSVLLGLSVASVIGGFAIAEVIEAPPTPSNGLVH